MAATPRADWYPDPNNELQQRWWDGTRWTTETRPLPPPVTQGVLGGAAASDTATGAKSPPSMPGAVQAMVHEAIPGPDFKPAAQFSYALGLSIKKRKYWKEIQRLAPIQYIQASNGRNESDLYIAAYIGACLLWQPVRAAIEEPTPVEGQPQFTEMLGALLNRGLQEIYEVPQGSTAQQTGMAITCISGLSNSTRYAHLCVPGFDREIPSQDAAEFEEACLVALGTARSLFVDAVL